MVTGETHSFFLLQEHCTSSKDVSASQSRLDGPDPPGTGPQGVSNPLALPQSFWERAVGADLLIVVCRHVALSVVHHCYLLAIPGTESSSHQSQQPPRGLPGLRRRSPLLLGLPSCSAPPQECLGHGELVPGLCPNQRPGNSGSQPRREARTSFFGSLAFLQLGGNGILPGWRFQAGHSNLPQSSRGATHRAAAAERGQGRQHGHCRGQAARRNRLHSQAGCSAGSVCRYFPLNCLAMTNAQ